MNNFPKNGAFLAVLFITLTGPSPVWSQGMKMPAEGMKPMGGMMAADAPTVPAVTGYSKGQKILFIHTETSDLKIAMILTDMMGGSPVLIVPSPRQGPEGDACARVCLH